MKLAISNIAWTAAEEAAVRELLPEYGVEGVETAPTKTWEKPTEASEAQLAEYRRFWESAGMRIPAMQALLFGRPELKIFESEEIREKTLAYLDGMMRVGASLGAKALVFGSPKNRLKGALDMDAAILVAADFFERAGELAQARGVTLCIEPNPPEYGCDFVNTVAEGVRLAKAVNHAGFRLHMDASAMILNGEDPGEAIREAAEWMAHFHISDPNLETPGGHAGEHRKMAEGLRAIGWSGWISIEMRSRPAGGDNLGAVRQALRFARQTYLEQ